MNPCDVPGAADVMVAPMARLRLFAGLRDAAGTGSVDLDGDTVGEVLDAAEERFGPGFAGGVERARVWVNGDEAERSSEVGPGDEIALIPPVSGGSDRTRQSVPGLEWMPAAAAGLALVLANTASSSAVWATVVVGVIVAWVADVAMASSIGGRDIPIVPPVLSVAAMLASTQLLGAEGLALGAALAVVFPLVWAVASDESRLLGSLSPTIVVSLVGAAAAGSLLLARRTFEPFDRATGVFLAIAIAATVIGAIVDRFSHLPFGDPFTATTLGAILTALAIAAIWDLDLVTFLIAGVVTAVALVGGSGLGSMLRTRSVDLVGRSPGYLAVIDGVVLAAALYLPVLRLVA